MQQSERNVPTLKVYGYDRMHPKIVIGLQVPLVLLKYNVLFLSLIA